MAPKANASFRVKLFLPVGLMIDGTFCPNFVVGKTRVVHVGALVAEI